MTMERVDIVRVLKSSGFDGDVAEADFYKSFHELGLDSLDVFSFFASIESTLGVSVSDGELSRIKSLDDTFIFLSKTTKAE
jgi:acyl carrier protein